MTWLSLQMILLGSLLIFSDQARSRCLGVDEVQKREDKFGREYWKKLNIPKNTALRNHTCAQVAEETSNELQTRALSPWSSYINHDKSRFPHEITFVKCLCDGCIIKQREDHSYNSVLVFAKMMVLKKTLCQSDPNKYVVIKQEIQVPVACTCVLPKYTK